MATENRKTQMAISKNHVNLLIITALVTYFLVTLGGVVCVTDSSQGCPDWPWCYGKLYPPLRQDSIIEYTHRVAAMLTTLLIVAAAAVSLLKTPRRRWVSAPSALSILFLLAVSFFGALTVLKGLSRGLAALDLGSALVTLALIIIAATAGKRYYEQPEKQFRFSLQKPFTRLVFWTGVVVFLLLVSGVLVAASGSIERCLGWPLYRQELISLGALGSLQIVRRLLAAAAALLILAVALQAWRSQRRNALVLRSATALAIAMVLELLTGLLMPNFGYPLLFEVVYVTMASAVWALLVLLLMQAGFSPAQDHEKDLA